MHHESTAAKRHRLSLPSIAGQVDPVNSRQRVQIALRHVQPDRLPKGFFADAGAMVQLREFLAVHSNDAVMDALGVDLRHVEPAFVGPEERSGGLQHTDRPYADFWGVPRRLVTNEFGTYSEIDGHPLAEATSVAEIDAYPWPEQEWFDTSTLADQMVSADRTEPRFINFHRAGKLFEASWPLRGMEQLMMDLVLAPEMAEAILKNLLGFYTGLARRVIEAGRGRIDMATVGDDVGTQRGMMMSPELWRRMIKPYLREMIRVFHDLGVRVMYHCCGSIIPILDDLVEIEVDILEPLQLNAAGMDPVYLKHRYGRRLSFHGGVDEQQLLPSATAGEVREEVGRLARILGKDGGYLLMAAHAFQPDIPCENVVAMYEAADHVLS